jgi:DNA recombination protein RmuC
VTLEALPVLAALAGLAAGALCGWLAGSHRAREELRRHELEGARRVSAAETSREAEAGRRQALEEELRGLRAAKERADQEVVALAERMRAAERVIVEKGEFVETSRRDLENAFQALAASALKGNTEEFLRLAEERWRSSREQAERDLEERNAALRAILAPLEAALGKLETRAGEIEKAREGAFQGLERQLEWLRSATLSLEEKTTSLAGALRGSGAQGRWGEIALRNIVELAGLTEHVDFAEQREIGDGRRPDMVVRLPGGRFIAVDAKVPFNAYVEAVNATTDATRSAALDRHLHAVREHVHALATRDYANLVPGDVDLVVLFLPGDSFLAAAFERDPEIQLEAVRSNVLIATPTTLVALLRTVAIYWQSRSMAENAREIAAVARELFDRASTFGDHLSRLGKGLRSAVEAFNQASGSFERRLLPLGRRLADLRVTDAARRGLEAPAPIEEEPRTAVGVEREEEG